MLLRLAWACGRGIIVGALACRIVGALVPLAMLTVGKAILDAVQVRFTSGADLRPDFWWLVALECALGIGGALLGRLGGFFDALLADAFARHVGVEVMTHASRLDLATYEDPSFHDTLERARVQATDRIAMVQAMGSLLQQGLTVATLSASIFYFSPWLLLFLVLAVVPTVIGESQLAIRGYALSIEQTATRRRLDYLRVLGASKEAAKELRLFGLAPFLIDEYVRHSNSLYAENLALARRRLWIGFGLSVISTGSYFAAYAYVIYRTVQGDLSWGSLQFLAGAIGGASGGIQSLFSTFSSIADQSLFLTDLVDFFKVGPRIHSKPGALPAPRPMQDGIVFENVSFSYPGNPRRVLDGVHLRIPVGARLALVGGNGQGKTTIVKLLTRLYDPTAGRILVDGVDLRDYQVEDLHRVFGVIFQDFMRYDMTAHENIAVGRIVPPPQETDVVLAARQSLAHDVIARLPHGYAQLLGRRFDGGLDLSGGEWQKLALARAYLRDAQLLVLDEPTAALDADAEYQVFQRFADLTAGRTALLISHRFSTVRMADAIVVLDGGRIVEEGAHATLVARGGRYASMFEMQAANYR
jgi:ATP-binding cassette subfamily B protein